MLGQSALYLGQADARANAHGQIARIVIFDLVETFGAQKHINAFGNSTNLLASGRSARSNYKITFVGQAQDGGNFFWRSGKYGKRRCDAVDFDLVLCDVGVAYNRPQIAVKGGWSSEGGHAFCFPPGFSAGDKKEDAAESGCGPSLFFRTSLPTLITR